MSVLPDRLERSTILALLTLLLLLFLTDGVRAERIERTMSDLPRQVEKFDVEADAETGGLDFIAVPIPIGNPTVGNGLAVAGAFLFQVDENSQPSFVGVGGGYTDNETWAVGAAQSIVFDQGRFQINAGVGYARVNYDFYGIGSDAGNAGKSIALEQDVAGATVQGSVRVAPNFYLGSRAWYYDIATGLRLPALDAIFPDLEPFQFNMQNYGIGLLAIYDSRDDRFSPASGWYGNLNIDFGRADLGKQRNLSLSYQKAHASITKYTNLTEKDTLVLRGAACGVWDQPPLFDLCLFGSQSDLRGYVAGRYRDRAMFATQVEYRRDLFWRLGAVAFAGVGGVAKDLGGFSENNLLPSIGAGLRLNVSEEFGVNFGIDYARGRDSDALYFRLGEAF